MASKILTQFDLDKKLKPRAGGYEVSDGRSGLRVLVHPSGTLSWVVRTRVNGRLIKATLGKYPAISLKDARLQASKVKLKASDGVDVNEEKRKAAEAQRAAGKDTFKAIAEEYLRRDGKALRSVEHRRRTLERLVYPDLGQRPIDAIKRSDVIRLLDKIEETNGAVMANLTLAYIRKTMNWHASRSDDYRSPIVRGMSRGAAGARSRTLTDDELRSMWTASGDGSTFGNLVRFLLLTAARKNEAAKMRWEEVSGSDWTLPAARNKVKVDLIRPLPKAALDLLASVQRFEGCPYVFTITGAGPIGNVAKPKEKLDKASGITGWTIHDLRRTSRSLLSRAGISADVAEMCLGHVLTGVRKTYDRHSFHVEKKHAFEALASLISSIIDPRPNVIALRG
jgi:integrase